MFENYQILPKTYFEIASLGYLSVLYLISFHDTNRNSIRSYKLFRYLEVNMLLALFVSILTYTFAYPELGTPIPICTILRTMDSIMCVMASRVFAVYLLAYVDTEGKLKKVSIIGNVIFSVYLILMILNLFFKFILWYTPEGTYMHGPLFVPVVFSAPVYYLASGMMMLIFRMKTLGSREQAALSIASLVTLSGTIAQAATNGALLLSLPFGSIGIFVLYFSLETADYHQLLKNNEKLRIAEQDAIKANRAKSDFLANMSHEIRTPLNAILGMDEMIIMETEPGKEADPSFTGRIRGYAENIKDAGQVLLSVINDILDLTKIESGKMEIKPAPYRLRALVDDVRTIVNVKAEQKGLTYVQKIETAVPDHLIGDELRIRQIIINLLNNAVKYTDSGKVEIDISMKSQSESALSLCICVKDTGIGIDKEDLPLIFGDFQRIDEKHNHRIEGTGLGLSIVKRMVDLMNGEIKVTSEYGKGSAFTVSIPQGICKELPEEAPAGDNNMPEEVITYNTPDCQYLVVDDNRLNLLVARHFLDGLNGQIETAESGEEALQKMRSKKYDMVFMDHMMPELDGIETYERSLRDPDNLNHDTPCIMMTANALNGMREEYLEKGFSDYISKPLEIRELLRIVKRHLPPERIKKAPAK
ncbi:MAG: response regulator [Lachnospiraceae bacterium]|nr:response regulator [Lachnospiraceae bacterium]